MLDTQVRWLPVEQIAPNPHQPRREFAPRPLAELAESIRRHGIIQPLSVRRRDDGWELIAGERRLRAAKLAGLQTVPCLEMQVDKQDSAILALIENIQRRDLHYLEEATAIAAYLRQSGSTQEEAAALLGRSPSAVANKLRLLKLDKALLDEMLAHQLGTNLLVLPTSVHELMAMPEMPDETVENMKTLLMKINLECVKTEEQLSPHVYRYDREKRELEIAD